MKAKVVVQLKQGVLDPQGQTIQRALHKMGYGGVLQVRQGKYFEIELEEKGDFQKVRQLVEEIAQQVLSNPTIECFEIEELS